MAYGTDHAGRFEDGTEVQRRTKVKYLGCIIDQDREVSQEVAARLVQGGKAARAIKPLWNTEAMDRKTKLAMLHSKVVLFECHICPAHDGHE